MYIGLPKKKLICNLEMVIKKNIKLFKSKKCILDYQQKKLICNLEMVIKKKYKIVLFKKMYIGLPKKS